MVERGLGNQIKNMTAEAQSAFWPLANSGAIFINRKIAQHPVLTRALEATTGRAYRHFNKHSAS